MEGVAIYAGTPGIDVESNTLTSTQCDATGNVGSLVITPSGSNNATLGLRVVAGLDKTPKDCSAANDAGGIVSHRTVDFTPHSPINIVVDLTVDCTGQGCDFNHTCVAGSCTDTVTATPPVTEDGGIPARASRSLRGRRTRRGVRPAA